MKIWNLGAVTAVVVAIATPTVAFADKPADPGAAGKAKQERPAKPAKSANKGNAYGKRCKGESKEKVAGQKHSPFVQCVKALKAADEKKAKKAKKAKPAPAADPAPAPAPTPAP